MDYIDLGYDNFLTINSLNRVDIDNSGLNSVNLQTLMLDGSIGYPQTSLSVLKVNQDIQSENFVTSESGWQIKGDGTVEFGSGYFRGDITGATGTFSGTVTIGSLNIPDTTTASSMHTDASGNTWWGTNVATGYATAPAKILATGAATFSSISINGGVIDGTSTIDGVLGSDLAIIGTTTADAVPTGLSCSSTTANVASDGSVSSSVVLTWTALATATFDHYVIRFKKASYTYYTYLISNTNTITIEGLTPSVSYNFGISSVNRYGTQSAFSADISQTTATSTTAPATVVVGSATAGIQYVIIEWTHSASTDLASYNIYRNTANDSATATLIGNCRTNYFIDGGRTGGQIYYYWVKAVNTSGLLSAAFSTVVSATPTNVESDDIVTLVGSKVLIDGVVYLSNWRHASDLTKIDGGNIYANSITTSQLNFTPVQSTNVIASINSSAEGITIDADNISISGSTTFSSGYDPTSKVDELAGTYASAASGARVLVFPDANTGLQVINASATDVFKVEVGGTNTGDVTMGNPSTGYYAQWDNSAATFTVNNSTLANQNMFGDGSDGDVTISADTSLSSDMFYNNLTIDSGFTLNTNGFRVCIKGTLTNNGTIGRIGTVGGNGGNAANSTGAGPGAVGIAGTVSTALADGSIKGAVAGIVGKAGTLGSEAGDGAAGVNGDAGNNTAKSVGGTSAAGAASGAGGAGGGNGGAGGTGAAGGTKTGTVYNRVNSAIPAYRMYDDNGAAFLTSSPGAGGSGSGGGGAQYNNAKGGSGGGSGASGSTGGIVVIFSKIILNSATGIITAKGGTGGNGGNGGNSWSDSGGGGPHQSGGGGGGAGGSGGTGGVLILVYNSLTNSGSITVAGGAGGALGTGGLGSYGGSPYAANDGVNGTVGNTGGTGSLIQLQI